MHTPKEHITIPVHGYPVMNDVLFPKLIDMGNAQLTKTKTKEVMLKCKVPIAFEFKVDTIKDHTGLEVCVYVCMYVFFVTNRSIYRFILLVCFYEW